MTDIYMDGYDNYGIDNGHGTSVSIPSLLSGPYADVQAIGTTSLAYSTFCGVPSWGPAATGPACLVSYGNQADLKPYAVRRVLPAPNNKIFMSFRFAMDALPANNYSTWVIDFRDGSNTVLATLAVTSTGALELRDKFNNLISATSGPLLVAQNFHFFELEWDQTTTTFTLRVDDPQVVLSPQIAVSNSNISTVSQFGILPCYNTHGFDGGPPGATYFDDWYVRDGSGTVNNSWLGDRRVAWLPVAADTSTMGWSPSFYEKINSGIANLTASNSAIVTPASTSLDTGSGDFTLETFVRFKTLPGSSAYSTIFGRWDAANNHRSYRLIYGGTSFNNNSLQFDYTTDGTSGTLATPIQYPFSPDLDRWYHIALVRASGELLLFLDGSQLGLPIANSATYYPSGSEVFSIGQEISGSSSIVSNTGFSGWLDETRITIGYARYTSSFTPTTVAFPRGSGGDPQWADVTLLSGYDTGVIDESGFARTLTLLNGATNKLPADGPLVGNFSTMNKFTVDDNTFMSAAFTAATGILTMTTQPSNGDTVTVGTKNGSTAAVYTFKTSISTAFDVLIDTSVQNTLLNLMNAINAGSGAGTKYGTGTTANFDVSASQLPVGQLKVTAATAGTTGNSIASTATGTAATWGGTTLSGGANIPGPSDFKVLRPPPNTTLISAVQLVQRMWKSDSGLCTEQGAFIGPLGTVSNGASHNITVSPTTYSDIFNTDPDTGVNITPSTLINGRIRINRTV